MGAAFVNAPASARTLDAGAYLLGVIELLLILAPLAYAAWRLRGTLLAGWTGAAARVVEAVLAISGLVLLAELLGTFAAFEWWSMALGAVAIAVAAHLFAARRSPLGGEGPPAPKASTVAIWLAAIACAAVAAAWMVPTLASLAGGMDRADSMWYHMPLATRFAHGAHFGTIDFFDPIFFASFYPANSEVVHAVPLLAFDRDILSPLINLGWLGLGLTAAYAIGRPDGVGPVSLIGGAIALGAQNLVEFQAGEALNDIVGVALVLCAVAILVNAWAARRAAAGDASKTATGVPESTRAVPRGTDAGTRRVLPVAATALSPPALATAGLAAGLAAGTKLSFLAPTLALFVGLVILARGARLRTALWFGLPALLTGGYWYLRNLIAIGNPIPYTSWGPLHLPMPERTFELRPGFSVFHYATDFDVWKDWFFPGLDDSFGFLWPLLLAAFVGAGVYAVWRGDGLTRVLGAVILITAVAYLFTPLTAAGEEGQPIAFAWNVRYLAPAAAIGLALLPCLPIARRSERARLITLGALAILFAATIASLVQWQQGHVKGALAAGLAVLVAFAAIRWLRASGRIGAGAPLAWGAGLAALLAVVALGAGWWEQRHYLERRYDDLSPRLQLADAVRWARDLRDANVAISGVRGVFNQYPFYGTDLSNRVQWLGMEGPDGAYERIPTCAEWRQALADGGYTHVVTTYDPFDPGSLTDTKEALWTRTDPAAKQILRDGPVSVFELQGPPDPAACGDLPDLTPAELDGESVNEDPTANQP
jgi:hypothetical protein